MFLASFTNHRRNLEALMPRQKINRISAIAPLVMSLSAFILVLVAVATGWGKGAEDEGSAAHIFQLLIGLQMPFILAFLVTADCRRSEFAGRRGRVGLWPCCFFQTVTAPQNPTDTLLAASGACAALGNMQETERGGQRGRRQWRKQPYRRQRRRSRISASAACRSASRRSAR